MYIRTIGDKTLIANARTFIIYKSITGNDLLKDVNIYLQSQAKNYDKVKEFKNLDKKDFSKLSEEEQDKLCEKFKSTEIDTNFIINFITALIMTGEKHKRSIDEIQAEIPLEWFTYETPECTIIHELIGELLPKVKKN